MSKGTSKTTLVCPMSVFRRALTHKRPQSLPPLARFPDYVELYAYVRRLSIAPARSRVPIRVAADAGDDQPN